VVVLQEVQLHDQQMHNNMQQIGLLKQLGLDL
jgi:hypothetical protein